ncbi:MAG TPA: hypothetical protein DCW90_15710 [Lachnospiraceae bacterium]|nr:coproporphyrinogen-III oxidase family protein [uncultured Lachnoclostridium sp.]HAU86876.1 hypothetical protein [Lachnospiraceae bacterium]
MKQKVLKNNYITPLVSEKEWAVKYPEVDREYVWTYPLIHGPEPFQVKDIFKKSLVPSLSNDLVVYIHLPACLFRCPMCPFYVELVKSREQVMGYAKLVIKELEMYAKTGILSKYNLKAIYFGGGTASLLFPDDIGQIVKRIKSYIKHDDSVEVTLEGHPSLVDYNYLSELHNVGVNRVSFGIQSFNNDELKAMGLKQTAEKNRETLDSAIKIGFNTVSADMLYRLPYQKVEDVRKQLNQFLETGITSLSTYSLELSVRQASQQNYQASEEEDKEMFYMINEELMNREWNHTAQPDYSHKKHISKETIVTWTAPQGQTLGLGAGACSALNGSTYFNVHSMEEYKRVLDEGCLPVLTGQKYNFTDAMSRFMVLGARCFVLPRKPFKQAFGIDLADVYANEIKMLSNQGLVELTNDALLVTKKGKYYVDNISKVFYSLDNRCHLQPWGEKMKGAVANDYLYME